MGSNPFATPRPGTIDTNIYGVATAKQMRFAREVMMNTPRSSFLNGYQDVKAWLAREADKLDREAAEKARAEAEKAAELKAQDDFAAEVRHIWITQQPHYGRNLKLALDTVLANGKYELTKKA